MENYGIIWTVSVPKGVRSVSIFAFLVGAKFFFTNCNHSRSLMEFNWCIHVSSSVRDYFHLSNLYLKLRWWKFWLWFRSLGICEPGLVFSLFSFPDGQIYWGFLQFVLLLNAENRALYTPIFLGYCSSLINL